MAAWIKSRVLTALIHRRKTRSLPGIECLFNIDMAITPIMPEYSQLANFFQELSRMIDCA